MLLLQLLATELISISHKHNESMTTLIGNARGMEHYNVYFQSQLFVHLVSIGNIA